MDSSTPPLRSLSTWVTNPQLAEPFVSVWLRSGIGVSSLAAVACLP